MGKLFDGNFHSLKVLGKERFNDFPIRQDLSLLLELLI